MENPFFKILELKKKNELARYEHHDFAPLLIPKTHFLGYRGNQYQRINILFEGISKDTQKAHLYHVKGRSLIADQQHEFSGTIVIKQIREYAKMLYGLDNEYRKAGCLAQGLLIGKYQFEQAPHQTPSGTFSGLMTLYWYVDKEGRLRIDDIQAPHDDGYRNNQYIGTWRRESQERTLTCNWGEQRVPFGGFFDMGAAYFKPHPPFYGNGWGTYSNYN